MHCDNVIMMSSAHSSKWRLSMKFESREVKYIPLHTTVEHVLSLNRVIVGFGGGLPRKISHFYPLNQIACQT